MMDVRTGDSRRFRETATQGVVAGQPGEHSVLIIGGGLGGLAAASVLAPAGFRVTLAEARNKLGGRTTSFSDQTTGEVVDNCQHVSMACCTNLSHFCREVGIADRIELHDSMFFQDEAGRISTMRSSGLPAPFHLAPSFAAAHFLSVIEKLRVAWGLFALMRQTDVRGGLSILDWLNANGQTDRTISRFWGVVLVSALNESLDRIDFGHARKVMIEGFLWNRESFRVGIPKVALDALYGSTLESWLDRHGVALRFGARATEVCMSGDRVVGCVLHSGEHISADETILAVPFHRVAGLLPKAALELEPGLSGVGELESSPITSVHLWYDRPVMDLPHIVAVGRVVQWLFRRSGDDGGYLQGVISASRELVAKGNDDVERLVIADVEAMLPKARTARLLHSRVVTERRATYSVTPGVDRLRPASATGLPGLWFAGDYVQTGWPATMEGAVRGGYLAAEGILARHGLARAVVQPSLPIAMLSKWLIRQ